MRKKSCAPAPSLLSSHYLLTPSEVKGALCPLSSLLWENSAHERMRSVAWDKQLSVKCIINLIIEESGDFSPGRQPGDPLSRMQRIQVRKEPVASVVNYRTASKLSHSLFFPPSGLERWGAPPQQAARLGQPVISVAVQ